MSFRHPDAGEAAARARAASDENFGIRDKDTDKFESLVDLRRKRNGYLMAVLIPLVVVGIVIAILDHMPAPKQRPFTAPAMGDYGSSGWQAGPLLVVLFGIGIPVLLLCGIRAAVEKQNTIKKVKGFQTMTNRVLAEQAAKQAREAAEWDRFNRRNRGVK